MKLKNAIPAPEHGIYILTKTVKNPRGDKRIKHDTWKLPEWKKGDKFVIEHYDQDLIPGAEVLRPLNSYHTLLFAEGHRSIIDVLVPHLERMPEKTLEEILLAGKRMLGVSTKDIIAHLIKQGTLSLITVKDAILDCKKRK